MKLFIKLIKSYAIIIIDLIEVFLVYKFIVEFKGVYKTEFFISMIIIQTIWYLFMYKKNNIKKYNLKVTLSLLIIILIPVLMIITQPKYSYEDGKTLIEDQNKEDGYIFVKYPFSESTIPVTNNPKRIFIANRNYYYKLDNGIEYIYFMVNPISGKVAKLEEDYWT